MRFPAASIVICVLLLFAMVAAGQKSQIRQTAQQASTQSAGQDESKRGERVFLTRCGNCHASPDQIPTRVSGTVLKHMRVRAILTQEEERLLMKYLAP